jgi:hypothetical protein
MVESAGRAPRGKHLAVYVVMLASAAAVFVVVRHLGQSLVAVPRSAGQVAFGATSAATAPASLASLLAALIVVIASARVLGAVFARIGQAPVIGEMIAGIVLGPSLLGRVWPAASYRPLSPSVTELLGLSAQASVVLFMFLVGLDLNPRHLKGHLASPCPRPRRHRRTLRAGDAPGSLPLPRLRDPGRALAVFALFSGVSLSVTAFPVLVRILGDLGIQHTRLECWPWVLRRGRRRERVAAARRSRVRQADATSALRALGLTIATSASCSRSCGRGSKSWWAPSTPRAG